MNAKEVAAYFASHDRRNIVGSVSVDPQDAAKLSRYSAELVAFYTHANPIDVEVFSARHGRIRFCPHEDLWQWRAEYGETRHLIVASRDGDPIGIQDGKVYLGAHGTGGYRFVEIAPSWMEFLAGLA